MTTPLNLYRSVAPTIQPLSLVDVEAHLRYDCQDAGERDLLIRLVDLATQEAERITWKQLCPATWVLKLDAFPDDDFIEVPRPPLLTISSIVYVDTAGANQTFSSGNYEVITTTEPGRVQLGYGKTWPTPRDHPNSVTITYTCGHKTGATAVPSDVPAGIRQAMLLLIGHWWENREAFTVDAPSITELPWAAKSLLLANRAHGMELG